MKWLIALFITVAFADLPDRFTVTERVIALTPTFDAKVDEDLFAVAHKRLIALTTTFDLIDHNEQPIATATARYFVWGTVADLVDPNGQRIGWIEENIFRILPWAEYRVFNAQEELLAIAKMDLLGTCFEVASPDGLIYATIHRPFWRFFRDEWTVEINNRAIDPRLLLMLAIYQTDKDHRDRTRGEILNRLFQDIEYFKSRRFD